MKFEDIKSIEDLKKLNGEELKEYMKKGFEPIEMIKDEKFNFEDFKAFFDKNINIYEKINEIKKENGIDGLFIALKSIIDIIQIYYKHTEIEMKEDDKNV